MYQFVTLSRAVTGHGLPLTTYHSPNTTSGADNVKNLAKRCCLLAALTLVMAGCATTRVEAPINDPFESVNRKIYAFNTGLDTYVVKPAAKGYQWILPDPIEDGIGNFFTNIFTVNVIVNDILQGKFRQAGSDVGRLAINSTVGLLGFIDVASRLGIERNYETFGQTFGKWGFAEGPFLMLPLFGPSNLRATIGRVPGSYTSYPRYIDDFGTAVALQATEIVAFRADLLGTDNLLDEAALDPYIFLRDFWSRRHRTRVLDDQPAEPATDDQTFDLSDEIDELDTLD